MKEWFVSQSVGARHSAQGTDAPNHDCRGYWRRSRIINTLQLVEDDTVGFLSSRMNTIQLFTIGFTKKNAEQFFGKIIEAGVKRVVDVRLNNTSQLAGFAKKEDLVYFLKNLGGIDYVHLPQLAPTQDMLDEYKKNKGDWSVYETKFLDLMTQREIEKTVPQEVLQGGCLLCSEDTPHRCHRRLIAEYLARKWGNIKTKHLI